MMERELKCLSTSTFPKAIVHVDMDSFFASCEQQRDPKLRNIPVVIGSERNIATSMSVEAKRLGIKRGMGRRQIMQLCPNCVFLPSDYETFGLYSLRLFEIVRQYSDDVEEYSVDECFAEITGMRRPLNMTFPEIVENIKHDIDVKLGTVCSIGLGPTKTLAKVASKWKKPNGLTIIAAKFAQYYLQEIKIGDVWGIGGKSEQFLLSKGIKTALDFAYMPEDWVKKNFPKPQLETWHELRGVALKELQTEPINEYHNISKRRTFTPPSSDKEEVFSRLCKVTENACIKARRYGYVSKRFTFSLTTNNFVHYWSEFKIDYPVSDPITLEKMMRPLFEKLFNPNFEYRAVQFDLHDLTSDVGQLELFGFSVEEIKFKKYFEVVDEVNKQYGKHTLHLGSSQLALHQGDHAGQRGEDPWRKKPENWLPGESKRKKVNLPFCGYVK